MTKFYDWPSVRKKLHDAAINLMMTDNVTRNDVVYLSQETDQFHPFDNDGELQRYLDRLDKFMCEQNTEAAARELESAYEAAENCVLEVCDKIKEHYNDAWNHPPGYKAPRLTFKTFASAEELTATLLSKDGRERLQTLFRELRRLANERHKQRRREVRERLAAKEITPEVILRTFNEHTKAQEWLRRQVARTIKRGEKLSGYVTDHVTELVLCRLRFPWADRGRAVNMMRKHLLPIVQAEVARQTPR